MMLSSGALRARIAAVVESLCRTAVEEITKVVEDGMMVLRLETCYKENEIKKLKGNIERLHVELRAGQDPGATRRMDHGSRENLSLHNNERSLFTNIISPKDHQNNFVSMVQMKPVEDRREEAPRQNEHPRDAIFQRDSDLTTGQKSESGHSENSLPHLNNSSLDVGFSGRHFEYSLCGDMFRVEQRRAKTLTFKNICPYCGKCFERAAHLERHKRIHTGEKPFKCETCGRCFNQNCSLKEHRKIHNRNAQPAPVQIQASEDRPVPNNESVHTASHSPEETDPTAPNSVPAKAEDVPTSSIHIKTEPTELSIDPSQVHQGHEGVNDVSETFPNIPSINHLSPPRDSSGGSVSYSLSAEASHRFYTKDNHMLDVHKRAFQVFRPKKTYPCQYCPKIFGRGEHLERHIRIHTGEKPYGCYICGRCFSQKTSLKGHMKTHDRRMETSFEENMELLESQHTFTNMVDPRNRQDWQPTAMVKLEPKEEPLGTGYESGDNLRKTNPEEQWISGISLDEEEPKSQEMDFGDATHLGIEVMPNNNNHCLPSIKSVTTLEEDRTPNGDVFDFTDTEGQTVDCTVGQNRENSYICSACGQNYDNFNLFQRHQCSEQLHTGEI